MNINVRVGKENLPLANQAEGTKNPEQALKALLQEGKILSARVLAQSNNNALLKLADLFVPVKTESKLPLNTENVMLKVVSASPEKTIMKILTKNQQLDSNLSEVKVNFTLPEKSGEFLNKVAIKPGETIPVKIIQAGENFVKVQIGNQNIELKSELQSLQGENVKVRLDLTQKEAPRLTLIDNGSPIVKNVSTTQAQQPTTQSPLQQPTTQSPLQQTQLQTQPEATINQESSKNIVYKEENMQLLNKLVSESKSQITVAKPQEIPETALKFSFNENEKAMSTLKNLAFENNNLKEGQFKNQEILNLIKLDFNAKTQMAEGTIKTEGLLKDDKLLLKPILEFKENANIVLKLSMENNKPVFTMDSVITKENDKVMNQLALKLGEFILEEKELPEIIKNIIDNKIPLTKENISSVQNFMNFFPGDAKTGMDMLLNQNLLMGLYYQLTNSNDKFLIRGYEQRKEKREGREKSYEFSILYESEKLGDILVDLEWSEALTLDFYCEEIDTVNLIENTLEELKENLKVKDIKINVEHNQEKLKKEPIKTEKIILTNIDFSV